MTVLEGSDITVTTREGTTLLDDVTVSLDPGETVLLAGPSGSGKTLLCKVLGGILGRRSSLRVDGTVSRNGRVGYLFQNPGTQLVRRRVKQDIAFGLENQGIDPPDIERRLRTWADRVEAVHLLSRSIDELSRGETAVVALLGTLVSDPDLVILDEPLAPLDERNRTVVLDVLDEIRARDASLLVAEHDSRELLDRTDRAVLLDDGRIRANGGPREIVRELDAAGVRLPFETQVRLATDGSASDLTVGDGGDRRA